MSDHPTPAPAPTPTPTPVALAPGRRDAPPIVRMCSGLDEVLRTSDLLEEHYGRSMTSAWVVGYIQGYVDFIAPPAVRDYSLSDPSNWPPLYDRVVAMLERGEAAAIIIFNEVRMRAGASTLPVPPPAPRAEDPLGLTEGENAALRSIPTSDLAAALREECAIFDRGEEPNAIDRLVQRRIDEQRPPSPPTPSESDDEEGWDPDYLRWCRENGCMPIQ